MWGGRSVVGGCCDRGVMQRTRFAFMAWLGIGGRRLKLASARASSVVAQCCRSLVFCGVHLLIDADELYEMAKLLRNSGFA